MRMVNSNQPREKSRKRRLSTGTDIQTPLLLQTGRTFWIEIGDRRQIIVEENILDVKKQVTS